MRNDSYLRYHASAHEPRFDVPSLIYIVGIGSLEAIQLAFMLAGKPEALKLMLRQALAWSAFQA